MFTCDNRIGNLSVFVIMIIVIIATWYYCDNSFTYSVWAWRMWKLGEEYTHCESI